ncbi:4-carboxy-4-hydroxy-2-oxoadipate aldolase/oxaloacetate decarboxylase [Thermogemmatispora sp.]|uniref:4-carboxy-4-hydroxy-2-oxoadipate aldolase/oxaloacetate decarboxylase n=1 Tax=Thermogemmatispora sp. TaxID=1968838 RepID=UPI0035E44CC5
MKRPVVVTEVPRPEPALVEQLAAYGVATVHEALGKEGLLLPYLRPIYPDAHVAGAAVTVLCPPGDNLMVHAAIEVCRPGDVLVIATEAPSMDGMFGELLATSARAHGVLGLVVDAGVRDVAALSAMRFPVWSRTISARGTVKETAGAVNIPVVCGGTLIRPGDVILGDADGVVRVPRQGLAQTIAQAAARTAKENATRERLAAGELGLDIYGLRAKLQALGVEYVRYADWEG